MKIRKALQMLVFLIKPKFDNDQFVETFLSQPGDILEYRKDLE